MSRPSLLLVTDLGYPAQGRRYGDEDVWLSGRLREAFTVALCSPLDAAALMDPFDLVLLRNSGPVLHHREAHDALCRAVAARGTRLVNPLTGRGDMRGKGYLLELTAAGAPVIPTFATTTGVPPADRYVVKPLLGADSHGLQVVASLEGVDLAAADGVPGGWIVQPHVDLVHELSFVFVGRRFCYALVAPDRDRRWALEPYAPTDADLAFAQRFVDWNALDVGVQRVDACRTRDGGLLLVELEDLNPYLSLDVLEPAVRDAFVAALTGTLHAALAQDPRPAGQDHPDRPDHPDHPSSER